MRVRRANRPPLHFSSYASPNRDPTEAPSNNRARRPQCRLWVESGRWEESGSLALVGMPWYRGERGLMSTAAAPDGASAGVRRRLRKSPFFTVLGLLLLLLAVAGFWPQYFGAVTGRAPAASTQFWLIHLHAALFTLWLLLYISQAALIMAGRPRVHMKMGPWLAAYGFAIAVVGLYAAALLGHRFGQRENDFEAAAAFVFFPIIDMVYFAGFLAAAVVYRKISYLHKRAMFLATFSIAVVGLGRLVGQTGFESAVAWQPLNLAPLLIAIAYDIFVCRKVYAIMAVGFVVHLGRLNAEHFADSEAWLPVGRALIAPFR